MSSVNLFVYGTLRSTSGTEWSRRLAQNATLMGTGQVAGTLFQVGEYRAMTPALSDSDWIAGEVFQLTDPAGFWPVLDEYEGDEYERRETPVRMDDGETVIAWAYYYRGDITGKSRIH